MIGPIACIFSSSVISGISIAVKEDIRESRSLRLIGSSLETVFDER